MNYVINELVRTGILRSQQPALKAREFYLFLNKSYITSVGI